jgi:hypothetical protein
MVTKKLLIVFHLCALLCALSIISGVGSGISTSRAQEMVSAKVLSIQGQVEIQRQPANQPQFQKIAFKIEDQLKAGDTIITGKNGRLVLGLSDGSQAVIAAKTTVVIKDLSQSPRTLFNVIRGKTRVHIEKLGGQPNPYRVNTPTAVIAVRGTIFDVLVDEKETQVFLHEGQVAVTNLALPDRPVILSAGQATKVLLQRPPNQPNSFKDGRNDGMFKPARNDSGPQDNRRVADGSGRGPDSGRSGPAADGGSRQRGNPPMDSPRPDPGRGGPQSGASRPNASPGNSGRRP